MRQPLFHPFQFRSGFIGALVFIFALLTSFAVSSVGRCQELMDLSVDGVSSEPDQNTARDKIVKEIVEKTSVKYIIDLIGEAKYEKNRALIHSKIIRQSNRYIPMMKETPLVKNASGQYQSTVAFKFSLKDLRQLLLKEGLLYVSEGNPISIPFIYFVDKVNARSYRWWVEGQGQGFLVEQNQKLLQALRTEMSKKGFYLVEPISSNLKELVPVAFRSESFRSEDLFLLGDLLKAQVVIPGRVAFFKNEITGGVKISVDMQALHTSNGRVVAEVARVIESKSSGNDLALQKTLEGSIQEVAQEFAGQILDVWQKGTLGANMMKIALKGNFNYSDIEKFKSEALKVSEIKVMKERSFAHNEVVFECEVTGAASQIAERIKTLKPGGIALTADVSGTEQIVVRKD